MPTPLYDIIKRKWAEGETEHDPDLFAYQPVPCACCGAPVSAPGWQVRTPRGHWLCVCVPCAPHVQMMNDGRLVATSDECRAAWPECQPAAAASA